MFCDQTEIEVKAGKGGDGLVSFKREKFNAKGGPDGGNGGKGGNIIFQANQNLSSLIHLHTKKKFAANDGLPGGKNKKNGHFGEDLILQVPVGTQFFDVKNNQLIADLVQKNDHFILVRGGKGGFGNAHFCSSVRQAPRFAEKGEKGEQKQIRLELKLVADVGIIGLPSSGKSTLISVISDAKVKIGNFPFTTLVPNLGVAKIDQKNSLVFCDIPGLIEGAHRGKGLGHQFLRHISRNLILVHLISSESLSPLEDIQVIQNELLKADQNLIKITQILTLSKIDLLSKTEILKLETKIKKKFPYFKFLKISSASGQGIKDFLKQIFYQVSQEKQKNQKVLEEELEQEERVILRPHLENKSSKRFFTEKIKEHNFCVHGPRIEQIASMTDYNNKEALQRLKDVMFKMGIEKELLSQGAQRGDSIFFGSEKNIFSFAPKILKN